MLRVEIVARALVAVFLVAVVLAGRAAVNPVEPVPQGADATAAQNTGEKALAWLEERNGDRALKWVAEQNEHTLSRLKRDPRFSTYYDESLRAHQANAHLPGASGIGSWVDKGWIYITFRDQRHPRGIVRRTQLTSYTTQDPTWEDVLDVDKFAATEGALWEVVGAQCAPHGPYCAIAFSNADKPANLVREFDVRRKQFVSDGLALPPARVAVGMYENDDVFLLGTDLGPGTTARTGFPLEVRSWRRGQPLEKARLVFRASEGAYGAFANMAQDVDGRTFWFVTQTNPDTSHEYRLLHKGTVGLKLNLPGSAVILGVFRRQVLFQLTGDWADSSRQWREGAILAVPLADVSKPNPGFAFVFDGSNVKDTMITRQGVLLIRRIEARSQLDLLYQQGGEWKVRPMSIPENGTLSFAAGSTRLSANSDVAFITYQGFLEPPSIHAVDTEADATKPLRSLPHLFDAKPYVTEQYEATSKDGTKVPYFVVRPKNMQWDGTNPTLIHAYGAYGAGQYPHYSATIGRLWLAPGGVYVLANIRGGDERGAAWHVVKTERQHVYEDFISVTNDLIARRITAPAHIGIYGLSAGGLLVGVSIIQHPELFNAAILFVPYLDQLRPDLVNQDQPWEYGSLADPVERKYLQETSPFQNLKKDNRLAPPLIITTTGDDSVHPANARRFAAKLAMLNMPYFYYEFPKGGHFVPNNPEDQALFEAMMYTYLAQRLAVRPPGARLKWHGADRSVR